MDIKVKHEVTNPIESPAPIVFSVLAIKREDFSDTVSNISPFNFKEVEIEYDVDNGHANNSQDLPITSRALVIEQEKVQNTSSKQLNAQKLKWTNFETFECAEIEKDEFYDEKAESDRQRAIMCLHSNDTDQIGSTLKFVNISIDQDALEIDQSFGYDRCLYTCNTKSHLIKHKLKKPALTPAERMRSYRVRQRRKQMEIISSPLESKQNYKNNKNSQSKDNKSPLSAAERMRAYRLRQREKLMEKTSDPKINPQDDCQSNEIERSRVLSTASDDDSEIGKKPPLTPAERTRAFRLRQREKRMAKNFTLTKIQLDNCGNNAIEPSMKKKPPLTPAERARAYRLRKQQKLKAQGHG